MERKGEIPSVKNSMFKFLKKKFGKMASRSLTVGKIHGKKQNFQVPLANYTATGERDAILASSGMGKSYLTGVLIEETLESGGLVCVIDPEGEHYTLAGRYPMMIIGGEHGNLPLEEEALDLIVEAMLQNKISAVFDLSEYLDQEQQHLYGLIAEHLFNLETRYRAKIRLVVEEAQIYAPQRTGGFAAKGKKGVKDPVQASQKIAKRGRKRAIDSLWATQRPASLNKDILSQCNRFWFGGITSEQDYKAIKPFLNEAGISFAAIKALNPGEFYFYSKGLTQLLKVRKRLCKHGGATPEGGKEQFAASTNKDLAEALAKLSEVVAKRTFDARQEESESTRLKNIIKDLEVKNKKLAEDLATEQMASKVIERLGSRPTDSQVSGAKKHASKRGKDPDQTGYDPLDDMQAKGPEKIYLDDGFVPEGGPITTVKKPGEASPSDSDQQNIPTEGKPSYSTEDLIADSLGDTHNKRPKKQKKEPTITAEDISAAFAKVNEKTANGELKTDEPDYSDLTNNDGPV